MKDHNKIELIVVFKKEIELPDAQKFLNNASVEYREGMDSSRGKLYFYRTGPKFILTFDTEASRSKFNSEYRNADALHEIYIPDWTKQKD